MDPRALPNPVIPAKAGIHSDLPTEAVVAGVQMKVIGMCLVIFRAQYGAEVTAGAIVEGAQEVCRI